MNDCCNEIAELKTQCVDINGFDLIFELISENTDFVLDAEVIICVGRKEVGRYNAVLSDFNGSPNRQVNFTVPAIDFDGYCDMEATAQFRLFGAKGVDAKKTLNISSSKV